MPLYTFELPCGQTIDRLYKISECPKTERFDCFWGDSGKPPDCTAKSGRTGMRGCTARRIIALGHGGIKREWPTWLNHEVREAIQDSDRVALGLEAPIETRTEYNRHLKERNIVAIG